MAGTDGLVSASTTTLDAIAQLSETVAPDFSAAFAELRNFGERIATETGWHGAHSEQWRDEFADSVGRLETSFLDQLELLETQASASATSIMEAGGNA